jgi:hypothetical protein
MDPPGFTFFDFYREAKENTENTSRVVTIPDSDDRGPKPIRPGKNNHSRGVLRVLFNLPMEVKRRCPTPVLWPRS